MNTDKTEVTDSRTVASVKTLTNKELDALYTATRSVKAKRQVEHEIARAEMIRRGLLITA